MHIPDGFINGGVSLGAAAVAAGGLTVAVRKTTDFLEEKQVALAGLMAAFIFAVQMLNFPVAAGTSGHLIGGVLAAVLIGPWAGALCLSVVLMVQALFADGGLTALGLNLVNMALVTALGGYAIFALLRKVLPATRTSVVDRVRDRRRAIGPTVGRGLRRGVRSRRHRPRIADRGDERDGRRALLIGVGEGIITAATVSLVLGVRPDLVYGASHLPVGLPEGPRGHGDRVMKKNLVFVVVGLFVAVALAAVVSRWASSEPDGLTKVAEDQGFASTEEEHDFANSPVAGYEVEGVRDEGLSKALSGLLGVGLTFVVGGRAVRWSCAAAGGGKRVGRPERRARPRTFHPRARHAASLEPPVQDRGGFPLRVGRSADSAGSLLGVRGVCGGRSAAGAPRRSGSADPDAAPRYRTAVHRVRVVPPVHRPG